MTYFDTVDSLQMKINKKGKHIFVSKKPLFDNIDVALGFPT